MFSPVIIYIFSNRSTIELKEVLNKLEKQCCLGICALRMIYYFGCSVSKTGRYNIIVLHLFTFLFEKVSNLYEPYIFVVCIHC